MLKKNTNKDLLVNKPWSKRYFNNPDADFDLNETLYTTYLNASCNRLKEVAIYIDDTNRQYTNGELLDLIDKASIGFQSLGIDENSKVGIFLSGSIEEVITLFALNKLGAVSKYIDFTKSILAIKHSLEETDLDLLVMDECFLSLEQPINEKNIPVVIANTNKHYNSTHYISYEMLYQKNIGGNVIRVPYVDGKPTVMINSSGSTGEPKPIVHTDYSVNAAAQKMLYTDYPLRVGNVLIKTIPSQIGLGLITSLYTGLLSGVEIVLISGKSIPELIEKLVLFVQNFQQFKDTYQLSQSAKLNIFTAPVYIRELIKSSEITDLSSIGAMLAAGSKISKEELDDLEHVARGKGCKVPICNGYGQNEMAGAVTLNLNQHNINGSAGFPTFGTEVIIVDPETKQRLSPNQVGLILESSNSEFQEYEKQKKKTEQAYLILPNGSRWFNSHDLGYMDEDGFLYVTGRTTRVVIRSDFKISMDEVERKIRTLPFVDDCASIVSGYGGSFEQFIVFVKSKDIAEANIRIIVKAANILSEYEMPSEFLLIENLPYKTNGKIDYEKLKDMYVKNVENNYGNRL